jgi:hypothetical protein
MWRKRKHIVWLMPFDRPFGDTSGEHSQCASVWDTKWYDITIQSADLVKLRCSESALTICTYQICDVLLCMVCDVWCLIFGPIIVLLAFIFDYHMFHDSDMKYLYLPECVYIYIWICIRVMSDLICFISVSQTITISSVSPRGPWCVSEERQRPRFAAWSNGGSQTRQNIQDGAPQGCLLAYKPWQIPHWLNIFGA